MNRWTRTLRHAWSDRRDVVLALGSGALDRLTTRVAASETRHAGEIRLCIEAGLPPLAAWRGCTPRERALDCFSQLRVWDTEANNGVLIYLLLADRDIEIVADRGLHRRVGEARWRRIADTLSDALRAGQFEEGLARAIDEVTDLLVQHFPLAVGAANPNELPNAPVIR